MKTFKRGAALDSLDVSLEDQLSNPRPVPYNFVGFSIEVENAMGMLGAFPGPVKSAYVELILNLQRQSGQASPVLRIGGNSADETWLHCYRR